MRCVKRPFGSDTEKIEEMMGDAYAYFPIEWAFGGSDGLRGDPVIDATTVYVRIPFNGNDYEYPTWAFSLSDLVNGIIDAVVTINRVVGDEHRPDLIRLRNSLNALSRRIEAALDTSLSETEK